MDRRSYYYLAESEPSGSLLYERKRDLVML